MRLKIKLKVELVIKVQVIMVSRLYWLSWATIFHNFFLHNFSFNERKSCWTHVTRTHFNCAVYILIVWRRSKLCAELEWRHIDQIHKSILVFCPRECSLVCIVWGGRVVCGREKIFLECRTSKKSLNLRMMSGNCNQVAGFVCTVMMCGLRWCWHGSGGFGGRWVAGWLLLLMLVHVWLDDGVIGSRVRWRCTTTDGNGLGAIRRGGRRWC